MAKQSEIDEVRELALSNLYTFACLINPTRVYGDIHKEVFDWLQNSMSPSQLLLLPRGHMKSHMIAVWCVWHIVNNPDTTILYLSATSTLAEKQLFAIKSMLVSDILNFYWPDMVNSDEGRREKWTNYEISVDHPLRREMGVRDSTVLAAGLTSTVIGLHADVIVADDVVIDDNAYTNDQREKVNNKMALMASILNPGGIMKAVGTRYHAKDWYGSCLEEKVPVIDDDGEVIDERDVWEVKEHVVEEHGIFLWPKTKVNDSRGRILSYGFDRAELELIKARYRNNMIQFYAQYYNNPNDPSTARLNPDKFTYYDKKYLRQEMGQWHYQDKRLNVYAGIDFAYSLSAKADYTAIVVIGIDHEGFIYVLDIDRFKENSVAGYYNHIQEMHSYWGFHKLRAEVTAAQEIIVNDLKAMIRKNGGNLAVDSKRPNRYEGSKEERIDAALMGRYDSQTIYHFKGGYTPILEEELLMAKPPHDDLKDCLASVVEIAKTPVQRQNSANRRGNKVIFHKRFGGVA